MISCAMVATRLMLTLSPAMKPMMSCGWGFFWLWEVEREERRVGEPERLGWCEEVVCE